MSNAKPKDHYIPQFYLDGFAIEHVGQKNLHIFQYMDEGVVTPCIKDAASEKDFYTMLEKESGNTNRDLDTFFTAVETAAATPLKRIIAEGGINISPEERLSISTFLAVLAVRTPGFLKSIQSSFGEATKEYHSLKAMHPETLRRSCEDAGVKLSEKEFKELREFIIEKRYDISYEKEAKFYFLAQGIEHSKELTDFYYRKKFWHLLVIPDSLSDVFITSDNPISIYRPRWIAPIYNAGYGTGTIIIPISPKKALLLREIPLKKEVFEVNQYFVKKINLNTIRHSDNFVFSNINSPKLHALFKKIPRRVYQKTKVARVSWAPFVFMQAQSVPEELFI